MAKSSPFLRTAESARWPARNCAPRRPGSRPLWRPTRPDLSSPLPLRTTLALDLSTQASACGKVNRPAYSALPTMTPSTPRSARVAIARRSSRLDTPPDAMTGASVRSVTRGQRFEIGTAQCAVLGDVGDDEPRTPFAVKAFQHAPHVAAVGLPAAAPQPVLAGWIPFVESGRPGRPRPCRRVRRWPAHTTAGSPERRSPG